MIDILYVAWTCMMCPTVYDTYMDMHVYRNMHMYILASHYYIYGTSLSIYTGNTKYNIINKSMHVMYIHRIQRCMVSKERNSQGSSPLSVGVSMV